MIGRIKSLSTIRPSGFIRMDSGLIVHFDWSSVRPPGPSGLLTGQLVTFDLDTGTSPAAINVRAVESQTGPIAPLNLPAGHFLQYMGFDQNGSIRAYRFKRVLHGEETREYVVTADMALFVKHHVGIQEGPALCLRLLSAGPDCSDAADWPPSQSLSDVDMLAHLARRAALGPARGRKRTLDVPAPESRRSLMGAHGWAVK